MKTSYCWFLLLGLSATVLWHSCSKETRDPNIPISDWTQLGTPFDNQIYNVVSDKEGKIYVSGGDLQQIAVWDGLAWGRLGNFNSSPFTGGLYWPITVDMNDNVYAAAFIKVPAANSEYHVAQWHKDSKTWINLTASGPLFDNGIFSMVTDLSGNLYVAGNVLYLTESGNYIYKWNGSVWNRLGPRLPAFGQIFLHIDKSGKLYACIGLNDNFSPYVALWNGASWEELGGTNNSHFGTGAIQCIHTDAQGNVYAGGYFTDGNKAYNLYKWTKASNSWSAKNTPGSSSDVYSIAVRESDTLFLAGNFVNESGEHYVAKFHQEVGLWSDYGRLRANQAIRSICFDPSGYLYAGGEFTNADGKYYVGRYKVK
ncbi:MAG: hypothetical protein KGZ82_13380 [Bacteroidales bacterium]|nr:hypothetical protein [Bacteroidales bacterium]